MRKALLVTHVSGFVPQFEMNNVHILQNMGYEVHYASNFHNPSYGDDNSRLEGTGIICHQIDFERSPFKRKNITAYRQLKKLMEEHEFDLVHCHTPMGGALARLAAHNTHTGPVIYTAHGFHFFKGAPLINWMIYYPVEWRLSYWTDCLVCINGEDYKRAVSKFHAKKIVQIPGVGINSKEIEAQTVDVKKKREELGLPTEGIVILSVGEMTKNKNQELIIRMVAEYKKKGEKICYALCGKGTEEECLRGLVAELGVENEVKFLGYHKDIYEIYKMADIFVFPSLREGMPVALMEAMASGLPVICSDIRGNRDLLENKKGGVLIKGHKVEDYVKALEWMVENRISWEKMGDFNRRKAELFDRKNVVGIMKKLYESIKNNK